MTTMERTMTGNSGLSERTLSDVLGWIKDGIALYTAHFGLLFVSTLIAMVLSAFSVGILAGPLFAGLFAMLLRLKSGDTSVKVGDVFGKLDRFVDTFLYTLGAVLLIYVGSAILEFLPFGGLLALIYRVVVQAALAFGLLLIVDRGLKTLDAFSESVAIFKQNPLVVTVLCLAASILAAIGAILFVVGLCLTLPIYACVLTSVYVSEIGVTKAKDIETESKVQVG